MPNPIIQNYLNDTSIPVEKRKFALDQLKQGVDETKVAGGITSKYGDRYNPESRDSIGGEKPVSGNFTSDPDAKKRQDAEFIKGKMNGNLGERISGVWEGLKGGVRRAGESFDRAKESLSGITDPSSGKFGPQAALGLLGAAGNLVTAPIAGAIGAFKPEIDQVTGAASKVGKTVIPKKVQNMAAKLWDHIPDDVKNTYGDALAATGLFAAPASVAIAQNVGKVGKGAVNTVGKVTGAVTKPITNVTKNTAGFLARKSIGLSEETMQMLKNEPTLFKAAKEGKISQQTLAEDVAGAIEQKASELTSTGKAYQSVRESPVVLPVPKFKIQNVLAKRGIKIGSDGELDFKGSNIGTQADKTAVKQAYDEIHGYSDEIGGNDYLNLRSKLDDYIGWESQTTDKGKELVKMMRKEVDNTAKDMLPGLKDLDSKYGPQIAEFKKLKKDYMNADGTLKDNAFSKITNLTKKGKEQILDRLEEASPGISDKIRAFAALEDVNYAANGRSVGSYLNPYLVSGGAAAGNLPLVILGLVSNPKIASELLMKYGQALKVSSGVINSIKKKISMGEKLSAFESKVMSKVIEAADNKLKTPAAITAAGIGASDNQNENPEM